MKIDIDFLNCFTMLDAIYNRLIEIIVGRINVNFHLNLLIFDTLS